MSIFQTIACLITFAALGAYINYRVLKLPSSIGLMTIALVMSLVALGLRKLGFLDLSETLTFVRSIDFSSVLLHGLLSFLLFAGALHIDLGDLKRHRVIIAILATLGVLIATVVTGSLVWYSAHLFNLPLALLPCLIFGALISPTDPVAVLGILKETTISKNLMIKIGCESLLNDGVGVVTFLALLGMSGATTSTVLSPNAVLFLILWQGLGSIILGLFLGWVTYRLLLGIDNYRVEIMLTLALVAGGYSMAEVIKVSAPITMVMAGLLIGNHARTYGMSENTRHHLDMFWDLLDEIINAILFMLVGLEMMVINFQPFHLFMGLIAIFATLGGRFVSVALPVTVMGIRYRFEKGTIRLLTWGGLRGGISIAMALSLPVGLERDLTLSMTYIVVLFSVLIQGTTFRKVARAIVKH